MTAVTQPDPLRPANWPFPKFDPMTQSRVAAQVASLQRAHERDRQAAVQICVEAAKRDAGEALL